MTKCILPVGFLGSHDYIQQEFGGNHSAPQIIAKNFRNIAAQHNSSAVLDVFRSVVDVDLDEVGGISGWRLLHNSHVNREETKFSKWLVDAHQAAKSQLG